MITRATAFLALVLAACVAIPASAETLRPRAVAELFTSQGCSSCPPADRLWNELAERPDVLALMLPVDYWDYLGWKDTLARPEHHTRQRGYMRALRERSVYTPQGVINGTKSVVGSRRDAVIRALAGAGLEDIALDIVADTDGITITAGPGAGHSRSGGTFWLVTYLAAETVAIGRGENTGRTITYTNVVRDIRPLGSWTGEAVSFRVPRSEMAGKGLRYAVILQDDRDGRPGEIRAAAVLAEAL